MLEKRNFNEVVWLVNKLINVMAMDMEIQPYTNEPDASFEFRVVYSALGLWCLRSALGNKDNEKGISKNAQSILLHDLAEKYVSLYPKIKSSVFISRSADIAVFIRNTYEQTGYLLTQENNSNILNNSGETVRFSDNTYLYLGLPDQKFTINGLGIHIEEKRTEISLKDFMVRDDLTPEEYLQVRFDECDFDTRDIDLQELEFFNPFYYGNLSSLWHKQIKSDFSMARKGPAGPYYRVIRKSDGTYLFADDDSTEDFDSLTGKEFRRNYIALKKYYDNPMQLLICPIDEKYTHIRILGQLPNREYYYLLMNAWPKNDFNDRNNFIIRNELTSQTADVLGAVGFAARMGEFYG